LIFRGKTWQGIGSLVFFCGIGVIVEIVRRPTYLALSSPP